MIDEFLIIKKIHFQTFFDLFLKFFFSANAQRTNIVFDIRPPVVQDIRQDSSKQNVHIINVVAIRKKNRSPTK